MNMQASKQGQSFIGIESNQRQEAQVDQSEAMKKAGMFVKAKLFEKQLEMSKA